MVKNLSRFILVFICVSLIQLLAPVTGVLAADLSINASEDMFSDDTGNYNNDASINGLYVGYQDDAAGAYRATRSAIKFVLNGKVDSGRTIQTAILKIYINNVRKTADGETVEIAPFVHLWGANDDSWNETDAPLPSKIPTKLDLGGEFGDDYDLNSGSCKSFDVTDYIKGQIADGTATFVLIGRESGTYPINSQFSFYDHTESGKAACLEITYTVAPTVTTTNPATNITATGATVAGNVTADGGENITARGFVYGTASNPTTTDTKADVAGTTGAMSATLTGLNPSTTYHVRAYATNSVNTSYGTDVSFTTLAKTIHSRSPGHDRGKP